MKIANVQEMVYIEKSNKWFHKWSSTLSDHQMKNASLTYKSSNVSIEWPMLSQRGVVTQIDNKIKESKCGISRSPTQDTSGISYKWCHSNKQVMSIKNTRFKPQPSTPKCIPLHQWETHLLWKLMTKGERLYKDMKAFIRGRDKLCKGRDKIWKLKRLLKRLDMNMDKEGAKLEKRDGSKFKKSTQVGGASSWTLIGCIWYVHIHVLACIA